MSNNEVPVLLIPANDEDRIKKLYQYDILDTPPEEAFDKIARLAAQIFDTPGAFVSFVDKDRVFFKSNLTELNLDSIARSESLCAISILSDDVTQYNDTQHVLGLLDNPLVQMDGGIRYYVAAPIISPEGYKIGTIGIVDSIPRKHSKKEVQILKTLSTVVMDELELRLITRKNVRVQADLMNITVHDLKSPLSAIKLYGQLIGHHTADGKVKEMSDKISTSAGEILNRLNDLLDLSRIENGDIKISAEIVDVCQILQIVKSNFEILAWQKNQLINIGFTTSTPIKLDRDRIQEVFENLLSNAIKYAYPGTSIDITVEDDGSNVVVEIKDEGQGLNETDLLKLFTRYARLSAIPTGKERSNGLGLSIVKTLVELHHGKVWALSRGKGMGTSFFVSLPIR